MTLRRAATIAALAVVTAALVLQVFLTVTTRLADGDTLFGALVFFFTFFTILSNLMVAAIYLSELADWGWLGWWRTPWVRGMMAGAIVLVMIVYHFVLFGMADFDIWFVLADRTLHYIDPTIYALWWLLLQPHGRLVWRDLPRMLVYPLVYVVWAMVRGAVVNEYPYPFLAAGRLGYGQVALNCLGVFAGFLLLYTLVVAIDRSIGKRQLVA